MELLTSVTNVNKSTALLTNRIIYEKQSEVDCWKCLNGLEKKNRQVYKCTSALSIFFSIEGKLGTEGVALDCWSHCHLKSIKHT